MATKTKNRNGLHKPGTVRIQMTTKQKTKAILVYTASLIGESLTDFLINNGMVIARERGIIDADGNIAAKHKDGFDIAYALLEEQAKGDK